MNFYEENKEEAHIVWRQFMNITKARLQDEQDSIIEEEWLKFYNLLEDDNLRRVFQGLYPVETFIVNEIDRIENTTPIIERINYKELLNLICERVNNVYKNSGATALITPVLCTVFYNDELGKPQTFYHHQEGE